ncbi:ankyrin repeat domain-containing protein [Legionella feeleii]|uniref:Ankyrin repeats (3 copies) n=1 Tax=Legionella feeleii TaxID=453 RepID=A0A378IVI0_9GAMM|nr:ankyrin repeat domain-containing protein [Legionella feeleii]STX38930.1 Ankyrin repeats (3 copies) [Legionella feeleii]
MAVKNFWARVWGLPEENESYVPYVLTFMFLWAPIVYLFSSLWALFRNEKEEPQQQLAETNRLFSQLTAEDELRGNTEHSIEVFEQVVPVVEFGTTLNVYNHDSLQRRDSSSNEVEEFELMVEQFQQKPYSQDEMANTPLTAFLAARVFSSTRKYLESHHQEVLNLLVKLCELAKTSKPAQELLTTANNQNMELSPEVIEMGMPSNTPLMLLIKAGDSEAVKLLLPFYSAEDLMKATPRGNSLLHIAAITGQVEVLMLLKNRALELGVWSQLKESKNQKGFTAFDILDSFRLLARNCLFKNLLDYADDFLGGEEINKAAVSNQGKTCLYEVRSKELLQFAEEVESVDKEDLTASCSAPISCA